MKHYRDGMFEINKSRADLNARIGKANAGASPSYRARKWVLSMSMCAAIALFAVISVYYVRLNSWSGYTASDETVRYVLPDSSVVVLAPGSELRFQKRKNIRHMEMSGKIFFNVAHDSSHPFTISVSRGLPVTVLGTRFQVDQSDSLTCVDVLDGKRLTGTFPTADAASVLETIGMACDVRLTYENLNNKTGEVLKRPVM